MDIENKDLAIISVDIPQCTVDRYSVSGYKFRNSKGKVLTFAKARKRYNREANRLLNRLYFGRYSPTLEAYELKLSGRFNPRVRLVACDPAEGFGAWLYDIADTFHCHVVGIKAGGDSVEYFPRNEPRMDVIEACITFRRKRTLESLTRAMLTYAGLPLEKSVKSRLKPGFVTHMSGYMDALSREASNNSLHAKIWRYKRRSALTPIALISLINEYTVLKDGVAVTCKSNSN